MNETEEPRIMFCVACSREFEGIGVGNRTCRRCLDRPRGSMWSVLKRKPSIIPEDVCHDGSAYALLHFDSSLEVYAKYADIDTKLVI